VKVLLADAAEAPRARTVLLETLEQALRLLHPLMPYVTEEVWQRLPRAGGPPSIMVAPFPAADRALVDEAAEREMATLMELVVGIRTLRATYEVEPRRRIDVTVSGAAPAERGFVEAQAPTLRALAGLGTLAVAERAPGGPQVIRQPVGPFEVAVPMAGLFDIAAERTRLGKERLKVSAELEGLRGRLGNAQFVERAKPEVVASSRERVAELEERLHRIEGTLAALGDPEAA
jgi:valyl-tRNA synthetase